VIILPTYSFIAIKTELVYSSFRIIIYNKDIKIIYIICLKFITIKGNKLDIVLSKGHKALKFSLIIIKKIIIKTSIPEA
jgi:hypothetical protein